jgi:hypothetical protein
VIGNNNGSFIGTPSYGAGEVGQAFNITSTGGVIVAASSNLAVQNLTIETWINPSEVSVPRPVAEYAGTTGHASVHLWIGLKPGSTASPGAIYGLIRGTNAGALEVTTPANLVPSNQWSHVALTFEDGRIAKLYLIGLNQQCECRSAAEHIPPGQHWVSSVRQR